MSLTHLANKDAPPKPGEEDTLEGGDASLEDGAGGSEADGGAPDGDEGDGDGLAKFHEHLARARGWKPRTEWKGDLPPTFVDDPAEFNRVHEARNTDIRRENQALRSDLQELTRLSKENFESLRKSKDAEIARLKADAEKRMRSAVAEADTAAYDEAQKDLRALEAASPPATETKAPPPVQAAPYNPDADPHFRAWHAENAWYKTHKGRTEYAEEVAVKKVLARGITVQNGRLFYDEVGREVEAAFGPAPGAHRPAPSGGASISGGAAPRPGDKGFDSLPAQVRADFRKILVGKYGLYADDQKGRAEYAKQYFEENPQR